MEPKKRLYRSDDAMIAGVCSGLAEYFGIDTSIVRILAVVALLLLFGIPIAVYIVAIFIVPQQPQEAKRLIDVKPGRSGELPQLDERQATPGAAWVSSNSQTFDACDQEALEAEQQRSPWRRLGFSAAITLGLMLAGIGVFALLGIFIDRRFWAFWPLMVILAGLLTLFTPGYRGWKVSRAGNGILLLSIGVVLQFWSSGLLPIGALQMMFWTLWPLAVVSAGLTIIGGALHKDLLKLIACLLLSLCLVLGALIIGHIGGDYAIGLHPLPFVQL